MLHPIDKPTPTELRKSRYVSMSEARGILKIRYQIDSPQRGQKIEPGYCIRPDFVFEIHVHEDGTPATWWQCIDPDTMFRL